MFCEVFLNVAAFESTGSQPDMRLFHAGTNICKIWTNVHVQIILDFDFRLTLRTTMKGPDWK